MVVIKIAYSTNLEWVQQSGLGIHIIDENVGTGDNSETDFDLDNDKLVTGGYTLSHAASGSNTFTALTETTHYTLDKDSGRIVLTAGGVTEVGTDIIFATYWYTDNFTDDQITALIARADDQIDVWTGRLWDTPVTTTEYFDGRPRLGYPTTDRPYVVDFNSPDAIVLTNQPVTAINQVFYLLQPLTISQWWNFDDGGQTFTDKTDEVNSTAEAPFTPFDDAPATGDIIYIGASNAFLGLNMVLGTLGVDGGSTAIDWEYWNGSAWTDLNETDVDTGASIFTASGRFNWTYPYGWEKTTVNSSESLFFIRGTLTDNYTTDPTIAAATVNDAVGEIVELRNISLQYSTMSFISTVPPFGTRNIRVDYTYGNTTTPTYITELSILTASLQAFVNLSGGSFDDQTSFTLGSKSFTVGEAWVNIREVISQIKLRIDEIYKMIGRRANIAVI